MERAYYYGANNTVMVHIRNLRQKIEEDPNEADFTDCGNGCDKPFTFLEGLDTEVAVLGIG